MPGDLVGRAVARVNPDLKMALRLRDVVGLSYSEIADSLEITLATVKWRIYKAREELIPNPFSLTPEEPEPLDRLPYVVIVIDELADLIDAGAEGRGARDQGGDTAEAGR